MDFKNEILQGIPNELPKVKKYDPSVNHAPIREGVLNQNEKKLALKNALRYFDQKFQKKMINYLVKVKLPHPLKGLNIILKNDYTLLSATINNNEINEEKTYNVATTDYLLDGGDKMYFLAETIKSIDINYKMRDVLIDYFKKIDTLKLKVDNRFIRR